MFKEMYSHILTSPFKLVSYCGRPFLLSRFPDLQVAPLCSELGEYDYDKILIKYGIFV